MHRFPFKYLLRLNRSLLVRAVPLVVLNRAAALLIPFSGKYLIDHVVGRGDPSKLTELLGILLAASVLQALGNSWVMSMADKASHRVLGELREKLQAHILRLPVPFHDSRPTGAMVAHVMNEVETMRNLVGPPLLDLIGSMVTLVLIVSVLLYMSLFLTFLVVIFLIVFVPAILTWIGRLRPLQRKYLEIQRAMAATLSSALCGVRAVKAHCTEPGVDKQFQRRSRRLSGISHRISRAAINRSSTSTVLVETVFVLTLILGVRQVLAGSMSLGDFFVYSTFLRLLAMPINQIMGLWSHFGAGAAAMRTVAEILELEREDHSRARTLLLPGITGRIEFDHVSFAYDAGTVALKNVNFSAPPGTVTAVVGHSGAGKSTIANLLALFYEPSSGTIRIDGHDSSTIKHESYRRHLGIVLQDPALLDGSIRENVRMARPAASERAFEEACRLARVDELAASLPKGYDTPVGERGIRLSGGQRQRIALARVVLADPRIVVFDEATSNIDTISAASIEDDLAAWMRLRTTFIISHRLNAICRADQILVLEGGELVETGTHQSLIDAEGIYARLYRSQYVLAVAG